MALTASSAIRKIMDTGLVCGFWGESSLRLSSWFSLPPSNVRAASNERIPATPHIHELEHLSRLLPVAPPKSHYPSTRVGRCSNACRLLVSPLPDISSFGRSHCRLSPPSFSTCRRLCSHRPCSTFFHPLIASLTFHAHTSLLLLTQDF